ncbi:MAG: CRTAC1 family protein [Rubrivivax sp.]|nr:CRTAC1 family protein [Rubrivivax sp.]
MNKTRSRWRLVVLGVLAFMTLAVTAACTVLVADEPRRPPPPGITEPVLLALAVPFEHRWARDSSHPLLAAAAIDIDGDGRDEVFLGGSAGQPDALLVWHEGALVDRAAALQLGDTRATYGALSLDLDGDGRVDLLTVGEAGLTLWLNRGARFEPRAIEVKLPPDAVPLAVTAGDFDRDGRVDLYLSLFVAPAKFRSPVFNDPAHAKTNVLLRNLGELAFQDVTDRVTAGLQNTFTSSFVDLDRDGWLDLVLAQNTGEAEILHNRGQGRFERLPLRTGYGFWMGLAFGDLHGKGHLDIFVSNAGSSIPGFVVRGDRRDDQPAALPWLLLRNDGGMRFTDIGEAAGLGGFGFAWGGSFEDINLDGALDLLVAENYVRWPIHRLFKLPGKVLLGGAGGAAGGPRFFTSEAGANASYGHVPLIADLDGDGRNDLLWANMDGAARAYLNRTPGRYLSVRLPDTPRSIGARVRLEGVPGAAVRYVIAGEGLTSDRTAQHTFGMPAGSAAPTALKVEWPDGRFTTIENPLLHTRLVVAAPP